MSSFNSLHHNDLTYFMRVHILITLIGHVNA